MEKYNFKGAYVVVLIILLGFTLPSISDDPELIVIPSSYDFGEVEIGRTSRIYVVVENRGLDSALFIDYIEPKPDWNSDFAFTYWDILPKFCDYGTSVWIEITFTPTSEMQVSSTLEISGHEAINPDNIMVVEVQLSGTGVKGPDPICSNPMASMDYDCLTKPENSPTGAWEVYDPYTSNTIWNSSVLGLFTIERTVYSGQAMFYRIEESISTADKLMVEARANLISHGPIPFLIPLYLAFGVSDGNKLAIVWTGGQPAEGRVGINWIDSVPHFSDPGVTDWLSPNVYRLIVDKSNPNPGLHKAEVYVNGILVLKVPYSDLTDTPGPLPDLPDIRIVAFGGSYSDTEWDYVRYEICGGPPSIPEILDDFDTWVDDGTLFGYGDGSSAEGRLGALRNMLARAGVLIDAGNYEEACQQLYDAYLKCDGEPFPPDFVEGESREELAEMILALMQDLGCNQDLGKQIGQEPENKTIILPTEFALEQNYPNPFNPETEIRFTLPEANHVAVRIFNIFGEEVCTLVNKQYESGQHSIRWNGKDMNGIMVPSGIYIYQLNADRFSQVKKMSLVR